MIQTDGELKQTMVWIWSDESYVSWEHDFRISKGEEINMRATIHYNGDYEDTLTIEADSLKELKEIAHKECQELRGWEEKYCWSEVEE